MIMTDIENENTTIPCQSVTRDRLKKFGLKDESWDNLLSDIADFLESNEYLYKKLRIQAAEE